MFFSRIEFACANNLCNGLGYYLNGQYHVTQPHQPTCHPDPLLLPRLLSEAELRHGCCRTLEPRQVILDRVRTNPRYFEAWNGRNMINIQQNMRNWRDAADYPVFNRLINQLHASLFHEDYELLKQCDGDSITSEMRRTDNKAALIFYDERVLFLLENSTELFIFATNSIDPVDLLVDEVLVVLAVNESRVVPCMWILIEQKSPEIYDAVLQLVAERFPAAVKIYNNWDFEIAEIRRQHFANVEVQGTWLNYARIIRQKARLHGINLDNDENLQIFRKLIILPFIQRNTMAHALHNITNNLSQNLRETFAPLVNYMNQTWIGTIGARSMECIDMTVDIVSQHAMIGLTQRKYEAFIILNLDDNASFIKCLGKVFNLLILLLGLLFNFLDDFLIIYDVNLWL